jgi:Protein of unknwon function (DUF3310)
MTVKFTINIGKYLPLVLPILSPDYLTPAEVEAETLDFIKSCDIHSKEVLFTNSPYVLNTFMLVDKAMSLITTTSLSNPDIDIDRYVQGGILDCIKTLRASGIYSIDVQAFQDGVEIPKDYDVISDNNLLNNHLKSFNDRFTNLLDLEVLINKQQGDNKMSNNKVDEVNNPPWYESEGGVKCIEITRHMNFNLGNVTKYVWRAGKKVEGVELAIKDLNKAMVYLKDEIERLKESVNK